MYCTWKRRKACPLPGRGGRRVLYLEEEEGVSSTWKRRKAYPLGGKYDLLSAL